METLNHYKELLQNLIVTHYGQYILDQVSQVSQSTLYEINLTLDLSLIIDSQPKLGGWIINYYPKFLSVIQQIVFGIVDARGVLFDQFMCQIKFTSVPAFETSIHDDHFKLLLMKKESGSLIHIKNATVVCVEPPKNYKNIFFYQCRCEKLSMKSQNLMQSLFGKVQEEFQCDDCGSQKIIIETKFKLCQKIKIFLHDLSPYNKKYGNLRQTEQKFKHGFQLMDIYLDWQQINKFQPGDQIYSLSYYNFSINLQGGQQRGFVSLKDYCCAINIDKYNTITNKGYFSDLKNNFRFYESQIIGSQECLLEDIKILMDQSKLHHNYSRDNKLFIHQILSSTIFMAQSFGNKCLNNQYGFPLKLALVASIFLENSFNLPFYLSNNLLSRSNILVPHIEQNQISKHLNVGIITEDNELIIDLIKEIIADLENVVWLNQCDEETFNYMLMNLINGGILIVVRKQKEKINQMISQIIKGKPVMINDCSLIVNCTVWMIFDLLDIKGQKEEISYLFHKNQNKQFSFDIVIDFSYSNLTQKQIRFDLIDEIVEQIQEVSFNEFQTTEKKQNNYRAKSYSSCYLVQNNQNEYFNQTYQQWIGKLQMIDKSSLELLNQFFFKLRGQQKCGMDVLHSLIKIASAISLMRTFIYSQVDDSEGLYQSLITMKNQSVPLNYSDAFLAILLVIETRINSIGQQAAIFGSDTSNYLYNCLSNKFQFLHFLEKTECSPYDNFDVIYDKILTFMNI